MAIGGVVVSVVTEVSQTIAQVPAEALGITRFQRRDGRGLIKRDPTQRAATISSNHEWT